MEIKLSGGYVAIIDDQDGDLLNWNWSAGETSSSKRKRNTRYKAHVYGIRCGWDVDTQKRSNIYLHRVILERKIGRELRKGELCDHRNGNTLDCRRDNLRIATSGQNVANRGKLTRMGKAPTSKFKGVRKHNGKWIRTFDQKAKTYSTEFEAAWDWDIQALLKYGEFANTNLLKWN